MPILEQLASLMVEVMLRTDPGCTSPPELQARVVHPSELQKVVHPELQDAPPARPAHSELQNAVEVATAAVVSLPLTAVSS